MASRELVLVTGGSGFIGSWCLLYALQRGFRVRTTVRSLQKADNVRRMAIDGGATEEQANSIEFCAADLTKDEGWSAACADCTYVLHVASPFPIGAPKHEDDLIVPARDGTLRVLKAAKAAGVKRVVITSSFAAIGYGHSSYDRSFTEKDWSVLDNPKARVAPYQKSKTIAERAAWAFMAEEGGDMELAVVNPVGVLGPLLSKDAGTSIEIVKRMLNGAMPMLPNIYFGWVDVRDVAELHLRAMTDPKAKSERFIATSGEGTLRDVAQLLKDKLGDKAKAVSTRELPNAVIKLAGVFVSVAANLALEVGTVRRASNEKATAVLGWEGRSLEEMTLAAAESCEKYGLIKAS